MSTAAYSSTTMPSSAVGAEPFWLSKKFAINLFLGWTFIVSIPFIIHAIANGIGYIFFDISQHRSFRTVPIQATTLGIASHMMFMGTMHLLAPVQLYLGFNGKNRPWHRNLGKVFFACAFIGSTSGWIYVLFNGQLGDGINTNSVALYGAVIFFCAYKGLQAIRAKRFNEHKEWAIRLFALGISSWLFRVIHINWYFTLGDFGANTYWKQVLISYGFYLIPLAGIEVFFRMKRAGMFKNTPSWAPLAMAVAGGVFLTTGSTPLLLGYLQHGFMGLG